jgi:predicted nuclease of predicted toxin-antitoxin system
MRFLLDQDVYAITARFLRDFDHDIVTAADIGGSRAADEDLLTIAQEQERIFVTRDRDFGGLVFVRDFGTGVMYLRIESSTLHSVHEELARVLQSYSEEDLQKAFVVVEPGRHSGHQLRAGFER